MWRRICSFAVRKENKGMRLQSKEIQTIIQIAKDIYGETVQVYLFGSRLNDEKHGRKEGGIGTHPHDRTLETAFGRPKD